MRIEYVSDVLNKRFTSEEDLLKAEKDYADKQKEIETLKKTRESRAKEVQEAFDKANNLLTKFVEDYGSYHTTVRKSTPTLIELFDRLFKL